MVPQKASSSAKASHDFVQQLNEEMEQNRISHPSAQDDLEMNKAEHEE